MRCRFCGGEVSEARYVEAGKDYCMKKDCVAKGIAEAKEGKALMLVPKQGYALVDIARAADLGSGRASGK